MIPILQEWDYKGTVENSFAILGHRLQQWVEWHSEPLNINNWLYNPETVRFPEEGCYWSRLNASPLFSIEDNQFSGIAISPNPTNGIFNIIAETGELNQIDLSVYDNFSIIYGKETTLLY